MSNKKKRAVIIDGANMVSRYESMEDKESVRWTPPSFIFNHIIWIFDNFKPDDVFIAWEGLKATNIRRKIYKNYKENRKRKTKDKKTKEYNGKNLYLFTIQHIMPYLPVHSIRVNGLEGDDVIARIVDNINETHNSIIISSDQDFYQLVNNKVAVYNPITKIIWSEKPLQKKFQIKNLENVAWIKAIIGDKSDDIKGLKSVGLKTIQKRLHEILNNEDKWTLDQIEEKLCELKTWDKKEVESAHKIIQLKDPLNSRGTLEVDRKLEYSMENGYMLKKEDLLTSYAHTDLYKDLNKKDILKKLLILNEFSVRHKKKS